MPWIPALVGDGLWTLTAKIAAQAVQLAIFVLAARILTPAEFGFFAFSAAIAILLATFAEGGLGEYVMKAPDADDAPDQVATLALITGGVTTGIGLLVAWVVYGPFALRWEGELLALFSLWLIPAALSAVYDGLLLARGRIRAQSAIRIVAEAAGLCVVAGGLFAGWNVFALVAGRLAMQLAGLCGAAIALRWLPRLHLRRETARDVAAFSRHILANRLIIFMRSYSGTLAIGAFLGLTEAGFYRAAERIVAAFSELVGEPARMLAWIVFRKAAAAGDASGNRAATIGKAATGFMAVLMAVSAPVYFGLALVSGSLVHFALGDGWAPVAILVAILSARQIFLVCGYVTEPLLSLSGTINKMPPILLFNGFVSIGLMVALAPFGILAAALGQGLAAAVSIWTSVRLQGRYGNLDWRTVLRDSIPVMVAIACMAVVVGLLGESAWHPAQDLRSAVLQVVAGGLAYCAALLFVARRSGGALLEYSQWMSRKPGHEPT